MDSAEYLNRLAEFGELLRPHAAQLDSDGNLLSHWFDRFQAEGLGVGGFQDCPLSGIHFCKALALLGNVSGSFGFLVLQQLVANQQLKPEHLTPWKKVGVAFGHLRRPEGPAPLWRDGYANGFVPWLSGAGMFDQVLLGMRDSEGNELLALVDAQNRPEFLHSPPLPLLACAATRTVTVQTRNLPVSEADIFVSRPPGSQMRGDAGGLLYHTPLLVGCIQALWNLIRESPRLNATIKARCDNAQQELLERIFTAFSEGRFDEGAELRAESGDFAVRLARLAIMLCGGAGLMENHPAQRLYREAMIYNVMAQTDSIAQDAFQSVLESLAH
jgi:hypothetical protein